MRLLEISPVWWHFIFYIKHPILYFKVVFVNNLFPSWCFSDIRFQSALSLRAWDYKHATNERVQMKNLLGELEPDSDMNKALEETLYVWWNVHPFSLVCVLSLSFREPENFLLKHFLPFSFQISVVLPCLKSGGNSQSHCSKFQRLPDKNNDRKKVRTFIPASCRFGLQIVGCHSPGTCPNKQVPERL